IPHPLHHIFFFSTHPPTPQISTLSLHDALPIYELVYLPDVFWVPDERRPPERTSTFTEHWSDVLLNESREFECFLQTGVIGLLRSEEHTSELQSRSDLVCRLLLEKKKKKKK